MKQPASIKALIEALFDALGEQGERQGDKFVVPSIVSSGYTPAPLVIDVQDVAVELLERFDISELEAPGA